MFSGQKKKTTHQIQDVHYQNWLLPVRKYLNVIYMWCGVDLRRQSRVLHLSYEATEILRNIPVGARLISAAAYLAVAADRRLEGGLGGTGGCWGNEGAAVYTVLCSVKPVRRFIGNLCSEKTVWMLILKL